MQQRKQTAFSFSIRKGVLYLFKWQLQRPWLILKNNNRKLKHKEFCKRILTRYPFHNRLQRPFILKGSPEINRYVNAALVSKPILCHVPVPTHFGLRVSFFCGQVKLQSRSVIWPKRPLHPRDYRMSPNFPRIREQGNLPISFAPTSTKEKTTPQKFLEPQQNTFPEKELQLYLVREAGEKQLWAFWFPSGKLNLNELPLKKKSHRNEKI